MDQVQAIIRLSGPLHNFRIPPASPNLQIAGAGKVEFHRYPRNKLERYFTKDFNLVFLPKKMQ